MTAETALDEAHGRMAADPDSDTARLRFYERLADAELFLLLEEEASGDQVSPTLLETASGPCVMVFDRAARLAEYAGGSQAYVSLSGRAVAQMLGGQDLGLALNIGVAPSETILPPEAVGWLLATLENPAQQVDARIEKLVPPKGLPENLIEAIDAKLATATGMAISAWLVGVVYRGGGRSHLLAFVGAIPRAQDALVRAASEALTFSGIEAGAMDVGFFGTGDAIVEKLAKVGLRFDLPQMEALQQTPRLPVGMYPSKPPILK